jgi:hypothetical protein
VKAIDEYLCARGDNQIKYVRCRVPADVRAAYPSSQTHITQSLGTSDLREAKSRVRTELARFEEEFEQVRLVLRYGKRDVGFNFTRRHGRLEINDLVKFWAGQVLYEDNRHPNGRDVAGLSEPAEFSERLQMEMEQLFTRMASLSGMRSVVSTVQCLQFTYQKYYSSDAIQNCSIRHQQMRLIVRLLDPSQPAVTTGHLAEMCSPNPVKLPSFVPEALQTPGVSPLTAPQTGPQPTWDEVFETCVTDRHIGSIL